MKKVIVLLFFFSNVILGENNILNLFKYRLNKIDIFYGYFIQKVINNNNQLIQEGKGELWIKYPNKFNFNFIEPEEQKIISNGKFVWIYYPKIEQVTIHYLNQNIFKESILNIIFNRSLNELKSYKILKKRDEFYFAEKEKFVNSNFKKFVINISNKGLIKEITTIDNDDYKTIYIFKKQKINFELKENKFVFFTNKTNLTIDDQR